MPIPRTISTPGRRRRHNDLHHAAGPVVVGRLLGPAHDDEEVGGQAVRGEPLVAVDDPVVALAHGRGLNGARVRARVLRFGHGEARLHRPLDQRQQPLALLLLGAVLHQHGLVARVRRHHAEERGRAHRVGQDLVHVGVGHEVEPHPAVLGREVGGPQPLGLDRILHLEAQRLGLRPRLLARRAPAGAPEQGLVGQDQLVDDARRPDADVVDVVAQPGNGRDGDGHGSPRGSFVGALRTLRRFFLASPSRFSGPATQRPTRARS